MTIELEFQSWAPFHAKYDKVAFKRWLHLVARESEKAFRKMKSHPPVSKKFVEYPAVRTGALRASIRSDVTENTVVVSSNTPYAGYLRQGTRRMKRRKMSDNALKEGIEAAKRRSRKWVEWSH
jgi:phage gpG-like protein